MREPEEAGKLALAPECAGEAGMIGEQQYGAVHSLYAQGMPKKQIARLLGLDTKTVRKWLNQPLTRQQRRHESKVEPFRAFLEGRGPEVGWNGAVLHREGETLGFEGAYSSLAR